MRLNILLVTTATILSAGIAGAQVSVQHVDVKAADGAVLKGTYYTPGKPGPGMLLLHQCNMDRNAWKELGSALAGSGIHVLAIDYRGYGDSPPGDEDKLASDVDAAFANLKAISGVDGTRLAAGGASCGVNNAIELAMRSGEIKALMLLSGPASTEGIAYLRAHSGIAIFAASSARESYAVNALKTVAATSTNKETIMKVTEKDGHGTPLFDEDATLLPAVVDWLSRVLR